MPTKQRTFLDSRGSAGGEGGSGILSGIQKPPVLLQPVPVPCDARCHSCSEHHLARNLVDAEGVMTSCLALNPFCSNGITMFQT